MKDKNIFSKFTLQTQAIYQYTKIQTCLQDVLPRDMLKNIFHQSILLPKLRGRSKALAISNNRDFDYNN